MECKHGLEPRLCTECNTFFSYPDPWFGSLPTDSAMDWMDQFLDNNPSEENNEELPDWLGSDRHIIPTYVITGDHGDISTLWQEGKIIACWNAGTGRPIDVTYGWFATIEQARRMGVTQ